MNPLFSALGNMYSGLRQGYRDKLHGLRVRNTGDPQLQAMEDYYKNDWGAGSSMETREYSEIVNRTTKMKGDQHTGFSGMPEFVSGEGTKLNPLLASMGGVGVTGFRGGSSPRHQTSNYARTDYLSGPFAGTSSERYSQDNDGELVDKYRFNTDKGSYDFKPKWYDLKYRTI